MAESSKTAEPKGLAGVVVKQFEASWNYARDNHHQRWNRNRNLYNNVRTDRSYVGVSDTFVPLTFSIVETLTAALTAGRPSIDFTPQDMYKYITKYMEAGQKPDLKALNAKFDYYWDCDSWDLKGVKTVRNAFIDGTSGEWLYWDQDKPRIINLAARDLVIDPNLSDPLDLIRNPNDYYTGRRYMTTKAKLTGEQIVDPETGELKKRYKNLDRVKAGYSGSEETEKQRKEMFLGAVGANDDLVEVIEIWTGERVRSVANRGTVIEDRKNELGIHCLAITRFIADESLIYGKSIIDPIAKRQEQINDADNQAQDAVTDVLNPQRELDPAYADFMEMITNDPGTVFPFRPGSLQNIKKDRVDSSLFNERQNMKNEIREATAADQVVQGAKSDGSTTATEINAQLNQAGQRFEVYVLMLEKESLYQRAKIVYRMMQQYDREMSLVPVNSMDGPKFRKFDPTQYDDSFEPKIQLEARVNNAKRRTQAETTQGFQALIADPTNDLWEVKKIMYPKMFDLSEEELDRIIGTEKPDAAMPGADPMAMEDPAMAQEPGLAAPVEAAL